MRIKCGVRRYLTVLRLTRAGTNGAVRASLPFGEGSRVDCALVLAGGLGLGAYEGGAYSALRAAGMQPDWVCGSSTGAVNAVLIAGTVPQDRVAKLRTFWGLPRGVQSSEAGVLVRQMKSWNSAIRSRLFGVPGHFAPRMFQLPSSMPSLYDLVPLRETLAQLVDFKLLNDGQARVTLVATDMVSGEAILFDNRKTTITPEHVLASSGLPPEFAPVEIGGRIYGDGGLVANTPVFPVLRELKAGVCVIVDLYSMNGPEPTGIEKGLDRKVELSFANQTAMQIDAHHRELALKARIAQLEGKQIRSPRIVQVSYRAPEWEAGPERIFDYSPDALAYRWDAGERDMAAALYLESPGAAAAE
jgi:NTE family protein